MEDSSELTIMSGKHASEPSRPIGVFVVDDDLTVLSATRAALDFLPGTFCCGVAEEGESALRLIPTVNPDVVLMDIRMPGLNGPDCVRKLMAMCPDLRVIMFTGYCEVKLVIDSLHAGARGYLAKPPSIVELEKAVRDVYAGDIHFSQSALQSLAGVFQARRTIGVESLVLTAREEQVVACLISGRRNKQIADELGVGKDTVHSHLQRLYAKLGVHSRREAVQKYLAL